ncbi:hypothetical protein B8W66_22260, partial [Mycobacterium decipiens]
MATAVTADPVGWTRPVVTAGRPARQHQRPRRYRTGRPPPRYHRPGPHPPFRRYRTCPTANR